MAKTQYTHNKKGPWKPYITEQQILKAVGDNPDQGTYEYAKELGETSQVTRLALVRAEDRKLIKHRIVCGRMPLWNLTGKKRCPECDEFLEYTGVEWACPKCENNKFEGTC